MRIRMWSYDVAREQNPSYEMLREWADLSLGSGYTHFALYLEHRFAYPSLPWLAGKGAVTPEMVAELEGEFPDLQIVPMVNLLGHCEGMLYTEEGSQYAEETFAGMQADPTNPDFVQLCRTILDDTIRSFRSEIIHIGGDETWQLGAGARSRARVTEAEAAGADDGKAVLYGEHFGPLARHVLANGRRPAIWADMFKDHPSALERIPEETILFDWQYFSGPRAPQSPHAKVYCPTIHTYNALWCHLPQSERNVVEHAAAAEADGALGVCVTTWEPALLGNMNTLRPAVRAAGEILRNPPSSAEAAAYAANDPDGVPADVVRYAATMDAPRFLRSYLQEGERQEEWARLLGVELQTAGGLFAFGGIRSSLRCRLLLYSNPFLLWLRDGRGMLSGSGESALRICERALAMAAGPDERGPAILGVKAIEFVRQCDRARTAYREGNVGDATTHLAPARQIFEDLEKVAVASEINAGGSRADAERCRRARRAVEEAIARVKAYGDGSLGYRPSFETITHPKFVPHDQGNWWLINRWANE